MSEPRQAIMKAIGAEGCYLLSIVYIAEKILKERVDAVELYIAAEFSKVIQPDCFVNDPAKLMQMMVPGRWQMTKQPTTYNPGDNEYEITRYERSTPSGLLTHFVVSSGNGHVVYDPLGESQCVKLGKPVSKRIFRKVG